MTRRVVLAESDARGLRVALMVAGRLEAIEIDRIARPTKVGMVGPARVIRIVRGLGALVKLADGDEMLLDREGSAAAGDSIQAQVARDRRGAKLAIVSREITLSGRGLIHLPLGQAIAASRRLEMDHDRRKAVEGLLAAHRGGWILRRTATGLSLPELAAEAEALASEGRRLSEPKATLPPPDAFRRLMTDYGAPAPDGILVAGRHAEGAVSQWRRAFAPDLLDRVQTHDVGAGLFDAYDLDGAIAALAEARVPLEDGASIVIEPTEALTAIDVNAGAAANTLAVNLGAAKEIARQLALRHIGGIVVIDFISMTRPGDRARVAESLKAAVADDPARTDILPMSAFGLIEMTRERRGPALELDR